MRTWLTTRRLVGSHSGDLDDIWWQFWPGSNEGEVRSKVQLTEMSKDGEKRCQGWRKKVSRMIDKFLFRALGECSGHWLGQERLWVWPVCGARPGIQFWAYWNIYLTFKWLCSVGSWSNGSRVWERRPGWQYMLIKPYVLYWVHKRREYKKKRTQYPPTVVGKSSPYWDRGCSILRPHREVWQGEVLNSDKN